MKRNKYIKYIITSLTILTLSLIWVIAIYHSNKIDIESKLEPSLRVAVDRDLNTRFAKSGMPYSTYNTGAQINKVILTKDKNGERSHHWNKTSKTRYTNFIDEMIKQSCLNDFYPIHPDTLNKYFNKELQLKNVGTLTAIKITDLKLRKSNATKDTILYINHDYKYSYLLGTEDEIQLDVFIQYTFISTLLYKSIIWLPLILFLSILIVEIYLITRFYQYKKEYRIAQLNEQTYRLGDTIFNIKEGILYKNNEPCKLRKQKIKLLLAFLQASNNFLSIEDINAVMWENENIATASRIHTLVSDLRKDIAPDLNIIKDSNKGYRLTLHAN